MECPVNLSKATNQNSNYTKLEGGDRTHKVSEKWKLFNRSEHPPTYPLHLRSHHLSVTLWRFSHTVDKCLRDWLVMQLHCSFCTVHLLKINSPTSTKYHVPSRAAVLGFKSHFQLQSLSGFENWDSRFAQCYIEFSFPTPGCTSVTRRCIASMCTHSPNHNAKTAGTLSIILLP